MTETAVKTEHFDVLVVGAGISGVGAAYHLTHQRPDSSFVVLENQASVSVRTMVVMAPKPSTAKPASTSGQPRRSIHAQRIAIKQAWQG